MRNHNRLLGKVTGVNGIKTGYTRASGFNLVSSVETDNRYLVAVVIGGETNKWRDAHMTELIKKYLPKASRGTKTAALVAGRGVAAMIPLDSYPVPRLRPTLPGPMTTGSVASVVGANSLFALDGMAEGDATVEGDVDVVEAMIATEADEAPIVESGWRIQLAATPTKESAQEILDRAKSKGQAVLASASPYTEPVAKGDVTLYRARFAGFADKNAAQAACQHLTKRNFDCIALSD
jgi:D-alanyl-D-alanine carboxypeptidase